MYIFFRYLHTYYYSQCVTTTFITCVTIEKGSALLLLPHFLGCFLSKNYEGKKNCITLQDNLIALLKSAAVLCAYFIKRTMVTSDMFWKKIICKILNFQGIFEFCFCY